MMEIECRCGAVVVEVTGKPVAQFYCHCDDCQKVHGAAYIAVSMHPSNAVRVTKGTPSEWKLDVSTRVTCTACGTRLFAERPGLGMRGVNAYLLPEEEFAPAFHIQCQFARLPIRDSLPHFASIPADWGGSDAKVDW